MKIRTDFVTNSSSSGFVTIKVKTNKKNIQLYEDYDSGWGGWIWNYRNISDVIDDLGKVKSGEELFRLLSDSVESFAYFPKVDDAHKILADISDRSDLKEIEMSESTSSDDGDDYEFYLKYDFSKDKVLDLKDGYVRSSYGSVSTDYLKRLSEQELFDLVEWHFDGCEENVWPMEDFFNLLDEDEQKKEIENFKNNNLHFDKNDKYVAWLRGSSNNFFELVDFEALARSIEENGHGPDEL